MAYKIEERSYPKLWAATIAMTLPEYSSDLYHRALSSLKSELSQMDVELLDPEYNFTVTEDYDSKIDLIDLELFVGVKESGIDTEYIKFKEVEEEDYMIRITADNFADIHTGIAEWMHDNDHAADGHLRHVISDKAEYVYDCPVKQADS